MQNLFRNHLLILIFFIFIVQISYSQDHETIHQPHPQQINHEVPEYQVEKQQFQIEQQFKNQEEQQLSPWIIQQHQKGTSHPEIIPQQSIVFLLRPNVTHVYRLPKGSVQHKYFAVNIYQIAEQGQFDIPQAPTQDSYVQVSTYSDVNRQQQKHGKVYISRTFQITYQSQKQHNRHLAQTHKYIKIRNNAQQPMIIIFDIQEQQKVMQIQLSDDQFAVTKQKIHSIIEQAKGTEINRQHLYKWQWGFYQKHQRHQTDMLGFTGAELFIIIATSIVQMYCIKNLVNDQLII